MKEYALFATFMFTFVLALGGLVDALNSKSSSKE